MKIKKLISVIVAVFMSCSFSQTVIAKTTKEKLREIQTKKTATLSEMASKYKEIGKYNQVMNKARKEIARIEEEVRPLQEQYDKAEDEKEEVNNRVKKRLRILYQKGKLNYMMVLLSAESISDFALRIEIIRTIVKEDDTLLAEKKIKLNQVAKRKKVYDEKIAAQQKHIDTAKQAYLKLQEELKKKGNELAAFRQFEELYEDEMIQINLEGWQKGTLRFPYVQKMRKPVNAKKTSPWGYRNLFGHRLHQGNDYGAAIGTPVVAAADGVVVSSRASAGYGWLITIYHGEKNGKHVFTRYAHSFPRQVRVRVGQQVYAGQQITSVGDNGQSTGPHLHFEVRFGTGDTPPSQNPDIWLSR